MISVNSRSRRQHESPVKILVADDAAENRRLLEVLLGRWGYDVVSASDGATAFEMLRNEDLPLAFLDWMMPGLEGPEICRKVRGDPALEDRYLILLTGRTGEDDPASGLEAGADDYLVKPVDAQQLRYRLRIGERVVALRRSLERAQRELEDCRSRRADPR